MPARPGLLVAGPVLAALLVGCGGDPDRPPAAQPAPSTTAGAALGPLPDGPFDYQLGGAYPADPDVMVVVRDRTEPADPERYSVCYLNGFQAQAAEQAWWERHHPDLLLRDGAGTIVIDEDWDEALLDISTEPKRAALIAIVGGWMEECRADGYDAVEPDNLDSYTRAAGRLRREDAVAFARLLVDRAHALGLPIAQKNTVELVGAVPFDFAITESCQTYDECDTYADHYGRAVLDIEYDDASFAAACAKTDRAWRVIRRDLDLVAQGEDGYLYRRCTSP